MTGKPLPNCILLVVLVASVARGAEDAGDPKSTPIPYVPPKWKAIGADDFEKEPVQAGWEAPALPVTAWASGTARSGKRSMRLGCAPGQKVQWRRKCAIPIKKDVKYRISIWVKCAPVYDHYGANFRVGCSEGEGTGLGWICGHGDWQRFERYFTPRKSDSLTSLTLSINGNSDEGLDFETGEMTAYFDDFLVEESDLNLANVKETVPVRDQKVDPGDELRCYSNQSWWEIRNGLDMAIKAQNRDWYRVLLERADRLLTYECFNPDGGQVEACTHYHMVTMRDVMKVMDMAGKAGIQLPESFRTKLPGRITDYFVHTLTPQLRIPLVGDNSDDHIHDVKEMVRLFGREDCRWVLSGRKEGAEPKAKSVAFPDTGFYVMRSGWESDAHYLLFRCMDHKGFWINHGHRDQLTFLLYAYGQPVVLERGDWGQEFDNTEFHNTIMLDGKQQNWLQAACHAWVSNDDVDFVDGSHPGYRNAACRRRIFFVRPREDAEGYWVMSDVVSGTGKRQVKQFLHLDPAILPAPSDDRAVIYACNKPGKVHAAPPAPNRDGTSLLDVPAEKTPRSGVAILLRDFEGQPCKWDEESGLVSFAAVDASRKSPENHNLQAPVIAWSYSGDLPIGSHQVFYPFKDRDRRPTDIKVERVEVSGAGADALKVVKGDAADVFCFALEPGPRKYGAVSFDGTAAFLRTLGGRPTRLCLVGGRSFAAGGLTVKGSDSASFSLVQEAGAWRLVAREPLPEKAVEITVRDPAGERNFLLPARR